MKATEAASLSCFEVGHKTATDLDYGLTSAEVADRHLVHGYNEFHITQEEPLWKKYIAQVNIVTGRTRLPGYPVLVGCSGPVVELCMNSQGDGGSNPTVF